VGKLQSFSDAKAIDITVLWSGWIRNPLLYTYFIVTQCLYSF